MSKRNNKELLPVDIDVFSKNQIFAMIDVNNKRYLDVVLDIFSQCIVNWARANDLDGSYGVTMVKGHRMTSPRKKSWPAVCANISIEKDVTEEQLDELRESLEVALRNGPSGMT